MRLQRFPDMLKRLSLPVEESSGANPVTIALMDELVVPISRVEAASAAESATVWISADVMASRAPAVR